MALRRALHTTSKRAFSSTRVGFIGAGGVNFGSAEGPWDHASRLEHFARSKEFGDIEILGIADPDTARAEAVLADKRAQSNDLYGGTRVFASFAEMLDDTALDLNTVIIGTPPATRGSLRLDRDMELQCTRRGVDVLVEKPLSSEGSEQFLRYAIALNDAQSATPSKRFASARNPIL